MEGKRMEDRAGINSWNKIAIHLVFEIADYATVIEKKEIETELSIDYSLKLDRQISSEQYESLIDNLANNFPDEVFDFVILDSEMPTFILKITKQKRETM